MAPHSIIRRFLLGLALLSTSGLGWTAGGLSLPNQSTRTGGAAFAFGPTTDDAASAAFFNPAGLGALDEQHLSLGGSLLHLDYRIRGQGHYNPTQSADRDTVSGRQNVDPGTFAVVPDIYYARPLTDNVTFGIGLNSPIGFLQKFPDNWSGRYQATATYLLTQNLGPSLGWRVTPDLRLGVGVNIQYLFFKIKNDVDAGTRAEEQFDRDCPRIVNTTGSDVLGGVVDQLGLGNLVDGLIGGVPVEQVFCGTATTPGAIEPMGLAGDFDFENKFNVDDIGYGWNIGLQYDITPATRIGLHFRSKIDHNLTGEAKRDNGGNVAYARRFQDAQASSSGGEQLLLAAREAATGYTTGDTYESLVTLRALQNSNDQDVRVNLTTPETISAGIEHEFTDRLSVALNYEWTRWSRFDELRFHYTNEPRYYDEVFQAVAGRELRESERVDRRDNPTVQPLNYDDAARYGIGFDYRYSPKLSLRSGFAYTEAVVDGDTVTDRVRTPSGITRYYTVGATYRPREGTAIDIATGYTRIEGGGISQTNRASRTDNQFNGEFSDVEIVAVGLTLRQRFE